MATSLHNVGSMSGVKFYSGGGIVNIANAVSSAEVSLSTSQVMEMAFVVDDPQLELFSDWNIPLDTRVDYQDLRLSVAVIEVDKGDGEGAFTIKCRPSVVRKLKNMRGSRVIRNVSPSTFVAQECKTAGARYVCQPSAKRSSVARDITIPGQQGNADSHAWSTFGRLASELGFIVFEVGGTIYFGKPSWFVKNMKKVRVTWGRGSDATDAVEIPKCRRSQDDNGRASVLAKVPLERSAEFRPGYAMQLSGVPRFNGTYFITDVDFPVVGSSQEVTITAETPFDPTPQGVLSV